MRLQCFEPSLLTPSHTLVPPCHTQSHKPFERFLFWIRFSNREKLAGSDSFAGHLFKTDIFPIEYFRLLIQWCLIMSWIPKVGKPSLCLTAFQEHWQMLLFTSRSWQQLYHVHSPACTINLFVLWWVLCRGRARLDWTSFSWLIIHLLQ